jgi:hypothetical protein
VTTLAMASRISFTSAAIQTARRQMLRASQNGLILDHQRHRNDHFDSPVQGTQEKLPGCAAVAPECRYHHIGIDHNAQCTPAPIISHAILRYASSIWRLKPAKGDTLVRQYVPAAVRIWDDLRAIWTESAAKDRVQMGDQHAPAARTPLICNRSQWIQQTPAKCRDHLKDHQNVLQHDVVRRCLRKRTC